MKRKLSKRGLQLLLMLVVYGFMTVELLRRWCPELSAVAAGTIIKRLRKSGWLESAPLDQHTHYYRLSNKSVRYLRKAHGIKVSRAATRPLKPYRKPERHAFVTFVSSAVVTRKPFRPFHDADRFPGVAGLVQSGKTDPLRQMLFYSEGPVVGLFILDRGGPRFLENNIKRRVSKLINGVAAKSVGDSFKTLINAGQFRLTIVTTSISRKTELEEEIRRDPPHFTYEILVMEAIAALLPIRIPATRRAAKSKGQERGRPST